MISWKSNHELQVTRNDPRQSHTMIVLSMLMVVTPAFALRCMFKPVAPIVSELDHNFFYIRPAHF